MPIDEMKYAKWLIIWYWSVAGSLVWNEMKYANRRNEMKYANRPYDFKWFMNVTNHTIDEMKWNMTKDHMILNDLWTLLITISDFEITIILK